jgi:hypothetical protein
MVPAPIVRLLPDTTPAALPVAIVPGDGAIEVVRGAVAGPAVLAAVVAWAIASAGVAVLVAVAVRGELDRRVAVPAWWLATAATLAELVLLVADGTALIDRRPTAALARLLLLAVAPVATAGTSRWAARWLAGPILLTVPLGAPVAGDLAGLAQAGAVALVGVGLAFGVLWVVSRRTRPSAALALGLVAVLAVPIGILAWPEPPPIQRVQTVVDGTVFDITVAPVAPGRNELHLYARDAAGQPVALTDVRAEVTGRPAQELFPVTADHWLSYVLDLPPGDRWRLTLSGVTTDAEDRVIVLDLVVP